MLLNPMRHLREATVPNLSRRSRYADQRTENAEEELTSARG